MKIAMMTNNYKPFVGGVPISVERLTEGLRSLGHEVCVFAPEYEETYDGWRPYEEDVVRYGSGRKRMENGMVFPNVLDKRIRDEFSYRQFDLIHVHQPMLIGNVAKHYSRKYDIPLVFTWHTRYEEYLHYLKPFAHMEEEQRVRRYLYEKCQMGLPYYMRSFANGCDLIYAPSKDIEEYLKEQEIKPEIKVLPTGLSSRSFVKNKDCSENIRKKLAGDKKYLLCTVSRLEKEKNLYFLLDVAAMLKERLGEVFRFVVVGDGSEKEALMIYAKEKGLERTVYFTGGVPNDTVKDYLFASDLFLFSSKSETQGIVLAEAMSAALPVVAVKACGVNDIVEDGVNGLLCEESLPAFAENVLLMLTDDDLRKALGGAAKKTACNYDMTAIAKRAEEGYLKICRNKEERGVLYGYGSYAKNVHESSVLRLFKAS